MRVHAGCGNVYLDGWFNIDKHIPGYSFLSGERPDLVEKNLTTFDRYYKNPYPTPGPYLKATEHQEVLCVADAFMDARHLILPDRSAEVVLAVQLLEHFTSTDAESAVAEWYRVIQPGGRLVVDVPDFEGLAREFLACKNAEDRTYYYQMIYCSHKNELATHKDGYDREKLLALLSRTGFSYVVDLENLFDHPYPSLTFSALRE